MTHLTGLQGYDYTELYYTYNALRNIKPIGDGGLGVPFTVPNPTSISGGLFFGYVKTTDELLSIVKETYRVNGQVQIYETLNGDYPQKFRIDLDIELIDRNTGKILQSREYCEELKEDIVSKVFQIISELELDTPITPILDEYETFRDPDYKYSVHLISPNWHHPNSAGAKSLYQLLIESMNKSRANDDYFMKNCEKLIDHSVYNGGCGEFRTNHATKKGERFQKRYVKTHYMNAPSKKEVLTESQLFTRSLIMQVDKESKLLVIPGIEKINAKVQKFEKHDKFEEVPVENSVLQAAVKMFFESKINDPRDPPLNETYKVRSTFGYGVALNRLQPAFCPCNGRKHHSDHPYLLVIGIYEKVYFCCRRCDLSIRIGQLLDEIPEELLYLRPNYNVEYNEPKMRDFIDYFKQEQEVIIGGKTVMSNINSVFIQGAMGVGKTQAVIKLIVDLSLKEKRPISFLITSPRKVFTHAMVGRYNDDKSLFPYLNEYFKRDDLKLVSYLDHPGDKSFELYRVPRLITQMESLFKLRTRGEDYNDIFPTYDLVIIDESEENIEQFFSETMKPHMRGCVDAFEAILKNATHVVSMDALLSERSVNVISRIRGKNNSSYVVHNKYQPPKKIAIFVPTMEEFIHLHEQILDANEKFYWWGGWRTTAEMFEKVLFKDRDLPHKSYSKYTTKESLEELQDINKAWRDQSAVIASPTINVGASYDELTFHNASLFAPSMNSCPPRSMLQGLNRVRRTIHNVTYYNTFNRKILKYRSFPLIYPCADPEELMKEMKNHTERVREFVKKYNQEFLIEEAPDWLVLAYMYHIQEQFVSGAEFGRVLRKYMDLCNYEQRKYTGKLVTKDSFKSESVPLSEERKVELRKTIKDNTTKSINYGEINLLRREELALEKLQEGTMMKIDLSGDYITTALAILDYKQKNHLINPMEIAIRERYYFDKMIEPFLIEGGDPADFFDAYWGASSGESEKRKMAKQFLHIQCGDDLVKKELLKLTYMDISTKEIMCADHLQKIAKLLPPEKQSILFMENIVLTAEEFDSTIGVYLKANESELRKCWELRNKKDIEVYGIFRSIIKAMTCEVELKYVKRNYTRVLNSITIHPLKHVQCFDFNKGSQKLDIIKEDKR